MPKIIVSIGTPDDGEYELDISQFSWRERAFITELAGVTPPDYLNKWFSVDPMTVIATTAIMMQRAGKDASLEALMDAPENAITVDYRDMLAEVEAAEGPPGGASPPSDDADAEPSDNDGTSG